MHSNISERQDNITAIVCTRIKANHFGAQINRNIIINDVNFNGFEVLPDKLWIQFALRISLREQLDQAQDKSNDE